MTISFDMGLRDLVAANDYRITGTRIGRQTLRRAILYNQLRFLSLFIVIILVKGVDPLWLSIALVTDVIASLCLPARWRRANRRKLEKLANEGKLHLPGASEIIFEESSYVFRSGENVLRFEYRELTEVALTDTYLFLYLTGRAQAIRREFLKDQAEQIYHFLTEKTLKSVH